MKRDTYNPDVLNCLANLSNDEVFTPPSLANQVLDLLPQELFASPTSTFLDPVSKSGVFLREIVKRLDRGLETQIPDRRERIEHILRKQVFGIAITELTAHLSRRSVYCSKNADSPFSVTRFDTVGGNIHYRPLRHTWTNGKCRYCGASQDVYDRGDQAEQYAYEFIHTDKPHTLFNNMKFDVIIGNPPYQLSDGGARASAKPIYHLFVEQAQKLNPRYLSMIIPARWYSGGKGLDDFRDSMLTDDRLRCLVDYFDATDCFPGIDISGGVCYFLWDSMNRGKCLVKNIKGEKVDEMHRYLSDYPSFIRFNRAITIIDKIKIKREKNFSIQVSARKPFGIETNTQVRTERSSDSVFIYAYPNNGFINKNRILLNKNWIDECKVLISYAYGERGDFPYLVLGKPFLGDVGTCCTETYLVIGPYASKKICDNVISYIKTKFFRFLVLLRKNTQHATSKVYSFVPLQDFSHPWTDEMLYQKYGLTDEEVAFIESMIRPME